MGAFENKEQRPASKNQMVIHPQLEVGSKDDPAEKDADLMSEKVMKMSDDHEGSVRRMGEDDEEKKVMKMGEDDEEKKVMKMGDDHEGPVRRMGEDDEEKKVMKMGEDSGSGMTAPQNVEAGIQQTKGSGQQLPGNVQKEMGSKMGADFSDVKIHTGADAHEMNESISAKAFTHGNDIYFKNGNYNPESDSGKKLLAHELTHTMQQGGGGSIVQRFGASSHERVESHSLALGNGSNKFSTAESQATYFGNWTRDFNQLLAPGFITDNITYAGAYALIAFMAAIKFGVQPGNKEVGNYNPKEHIDNPGAVYPELDYFQNSKELTGWGKYLDAPYRYGLKEMTPQVNIDTIFNNNFSGTIESSSSKTNPIDLFSVDQHGIMAYISDTNQHVERRLKLAANEGRTEQGFFHLGVALHAIEDMFAHSNFTEIALSKILKDEGPGYDKKKNPGQKNNSVLLPELKGNDRDVFTFMPEMEVENIREDKNGKKTKEIQSRPILTTGTFTPTDAMVSIAGEVVDFLNAFKLDKPDSNFTLTDKAEVAFDNLLKAISPKISKEVGALVGAYVKGKATFNLFSKAIEELIQKQGVYGVYKSAKNFLLGFPGNLLPKNASKELVKYIIKESLKWLLDLLKGYVQGSGIESKVATTPLYMEVQRQKEVKGKINKYFTDSIHPKNREIINKLNGNPSSDDIKNAEKNIGIMKGLSKKNNYAEKHLGIYGDRNQEQLKGPSHSQIAKDHPNSIFYGLAFALASEADKRIKDKMLVAWKGMPSKRPSFVENFTKEQLSGAADKRKEGNEIIKNGNLAGQQYDPDKIRNSKVGQLNAFIFTMNTLASYSVPFYYRTEYKNTLAELNGIANEMVKMDVYDYEERITLFEKLTNAKKSLHKIFNPKSYFMMPLYTYSPLSDKMTYYLAPLEEVIGFLAPNHYRDQKSFASQSLPNKNDQFKSVRIDLPDVKNDIKLSEPVKDLLLESRKLVGHPFDDNWWVETVRNYIKKNPAQIMNEIKMRNAGYTVGEGHEH